MLVNSNIEIYRDFPFTQLSVYDKFLQISKVKKRHGVKHSSTTSMTTPQKKVMGRFNFLPTHTNYLFLSNIGMILSLP